MSEEREALGPGASREALTQRYARSLALSARTASALAACRDGGHIDKLKREIAELKNKIQWQEERIAWLRRPLIVRAFLKYFGGK